MQIAQGVDIVHFIPGRVRLKVQQARGNAVLAQSIEAKLGAVPGIGRVEVHAVTGSVLISYDTTALRTSAGQLVAVLGELFPGADTGRLWGWLGAG